MVFECDFEFRIKKKIYQHPTIYILVTRRERERERAIRRKRAFKKNHYEQVNSDAPERFYGLKVRYSGFFEIADYESGIKILQIQNSGSNMVYYLCNIIGIP